MIPSQGNFKFPFFSSLIYVLLTFFKGSTRSWMNPLLIWSPTIAWFDLYLCLSKRKRWCSMSKMLLIRSVFDSFLLYIDLWVLLSFKRPSGTALEHRRSEICVTSWVLRFVTQTLNIQKHLKWENLSWLTLMMKNHPNAQNATRIN